MSPSTEQQYSVLTPTCTCRCLVRAYVRQETLYRSPVLFVAVSRAPTGPEMDIPPSEDDGGAIAMIGHERWMDGYVAGVPRLIQRLERQEPPRHVLALSESDHAGCLKRHFLNMTCPTQVSVQPSSGGSNWYVLTRA